MIKSMTGYGKGEFAVNNRKFTVEIKSVNHRYFDINFRIPKTLSMYEENVRKYVSNILTRGKLEINIKFDNLSDLGKNISIDDEMLNHYLLECERVSKKFNIENDIKLSDLLKLDLFKFEQIENDSDLIWNELFEAVKLAVVNYNDMRTFEGEKISQDILNKINQLNGNILEIEKYSGNVVEEYKNKLYDRVKSYVDQEKVDNHRILTEVVIFADKMTIDEEIIRFKSHLNQFEKELISDKTSGKKMDFIIQELNRETNTIGSKTNCLDITNLVILNKSIIENIREQIQNVE